MSRHIWTNLTDADETIQKLETGCVIANEDTLICLTILFNVCNVYLDVCSYCL